MPANRLGIDLGEVYSDAERIKGQRLNNEYARMKMDSLTEDRAIARDDRRRQQNQNMLMLPLREQAARGDEDARAKIIAIDPKGGPAFIEKLNTLDKQGIDALEKNLDVIGNMAATILQEKNPERQIEMYKQFYEQAPEAMRRRMPKSNIIGFLKQSLAQVTAMDQLTSEVKSVRFGGEDILYQGNKEIGRAKRPMTASEKEAATGVPDKEIRTMGKLITQTLGGKFVRDSQGELVFTGLDDTQNRKGMAALNRAEELRNEGMPITEAAKQALEEFGTDFPKRQIKPPTEAKASSRYKSVGGVRYERQGDGSWKPL